MLKKLNMYFFGAEEISFYDSLLFYGFYTFMVIVLIFTFGVSAMN